jgi:hypothetical protein
MKSILSLLSIIALGFGLVGCQGGGGGSGEDGPAAFAVSTSAADYGVVGNAYTSTRHATALSRSEHGCREWHARRSRRRYCDIHGDG